MNQRRTSSLLLLATLFAGCAGSGGGSGSDLVELLPNGYLSEASTRAVRREMDFQRGTQAYLQLLPLVAVMQWKNAHEAMGGGPGDWIVYDTVELKLPILTANATTPYILTFANLEDTDGMLMLEVPPGPTGGLVNDVWQRPVTDLGLAGPDGGAGGKYLLVLEGTQVPEEHGADFLVTVETNTLLFGTRILTKDPEEMRRLIEGHKLYPVGGVASGRVFQAPSADWEGWQPRGLEYWRTAHRGIQDNPVNERDLFMMQGLKNLGIERGRPFEPTAEQRTILEEAAFLGEAMAMANTFSKREPLRHWDEESSQWHYPFWMQDPITQMTENYGELDARSSYFYEAVSTSRGMTADIVGAGSKYLGSYHDGDHEWLDGKNTYELVIPPNPPAGQFWSIVLYDNDTRALIVNDTGKPEVNSLMDLAVEEDGSVRLVFSPEAPEGPLSNWIQTNPRKGFFAYLRLYAPLEPFFDRSWKLGNIERID